MAINYGVLLLFVALCSEYFAVLQAQDERCEPGWSYYGGNCYFRVDKSKLRATWNDAQANCQSKQANLVTINDINEQKFLNGIFGRKGSWCGLNNLDNENVFQWISGKQSDFTYWAPKEPRKSVKNRCVHSADSKQHKWRVVDCSNSFRYTCEKAAAGPVKPCASMPCKNGGTCIEQGQGYQCQCAEGFTGDQCESEKVNPCDSGPCQNGGTCTATNDGYTCQCTEKFTGDQCEQSLDPCAPNPCQNGGQCYDLGESEHYCACDSGFTGDNCEKVNCGDDPCRNGGTCLDLGDTAICKCRPGFTGSICQGVIPSITKNPIDSVRMVGDAVKFCCKAKGDPAPKYAWFRNEVQVPNEASDSLSLSSVSKADASSYKCRATNEYGSVFSREAELTVVDGSGDDSCDSNPLSKVETLPPGCTEDSSGSSSVNVGACSYDTCVKRGQGDSGECEEQEGSRQCCSPASRIDSPVTCTNGAKFSIQKVSRCACAKCAVPDTIVHGRAVDPDGNPLKQGDISVEGDQRRYKTDLSGYFKIYVKQGTKRLVFTVADKRLRQLQETTKALTLHEGQVSFYTIVLQKKPPAITFSAKQEQNINLGGSSGKPSFANLDIPANAFVTVDGTTYDGEITANIGVVDPRSQADMAAAPGDFSAIDENGEEEMLSTAGILRQTFTDNSGNQLSLGKNITVRVDADQLDIPDGVEVYQWYLNKQTGRWVKFGVLRPENGGQRRKRQQARKFFVSDITPNVPYDTINWDYVSVAAYVRVRAQRGTVVTRIGGPANGPFTSYRQETVPDNGILCILSVRDKPAVLQADLSGVPQIPQQLPPNFPAQVAAQIISPSSGVSSFQFTATNVGDTGPVYLKGESGRCQQSGPNDLAFQFGAASSGTSFHWESKSSTWFMGSICYMKAVVSGSLLESVIYVKGTGKAQSQPDQDYGYMAEKSAVVGNQGVVCLEYSCNQGPTAAYQTHLQVLSLTGKCTLSLNSALAGGQSSCRVPPDADSSTEQNFCVPMLQGGGAGLYRDNTALAKIKCLAGDNSYTGPTQASPGPPPTTATGWAVQLSCN